MVAGAEPGIGDRLEVRRESKRCALSTSSIAPIEPLDEGVLIRLAGLDRVNPRSYRRRAGGSG